MQGHPATLNRKRAMDAAAEERRPYEPFEPSEFYAWWLKDLEALPPAYEVKSPDWELLQIEEVPSKAQLATWLQASAALFEHFQGKGIDLALARMTWDGKPAVATYRRAGGPEAETP